LGIKNEDKLLLFKIICLIKSNVSLAHPVLWPIVTNDNEAKNAAKLVADF